LYVRNWRMPGIGRNTSVRKCDGSRHPLPRKALQDKGLQDPKKHRN